MYVFDYGAPETIIGQYTFRTKEGSVSPDGCTLKIHFVDSCKFALESCCEEIAELIRKIFP